MGHFYKREEETIMANLLSSLISRSHGMMGVMGFNPMLSMKAPLSTTCMLEMPSCKKWRKPHPVPEKVGVNPYKGQALQEWWEGDGKGPYKYRHHHYPNNITLRDVQRRRIFKQHHRERELHRAIYLNDLLPKELQEKARQKVVWETPADSDRMRPNFRCVLTGRARGNWNDFRVSRFVFRGEADYNRVSGVQRAHWTHNTEIDP